MTNPNNAAQAAKLQTVLSFDERERILCQFMGEPINHDRDLAVAIESAVLSKVRAPASSIREAFELTYAADADDPASATELSHFTNGWRACVMSQVRAPVADERAAFARSVTGRDDLEPYQVENVIDANRSRWKTWQDRAALATVPLPNQSPIRLSAEVLEYMKEGIDSATQCEEADIDHDFANELGRLMQGPLFGAPLASAPVAGEAQPVACLRRQRVRSDWGHWAPGTVEDGQRVTGLRSWQVRWLVDAAPQASAEPATYTTCPGESVMGIALRELGNEKAWRHILACNPQFADLLPHEYFPVGTVLTLPQAPQNVRPCSCPSGDGSLRHPCAVHQASEAVRDAGIAASEDVVLPPLPEALALQPGQLGHTDQTLDYFARAAVLADRQQRADRSQVARNECDCATCRPHSVEMRMILCSICGDKRCPHAADHRNACTATQPEQGERDA